MQISETLVFNQNNQTFVEYNGEHYVIDINDYQMKDGQSLKIGLIENQNFYPDIFRNSISSNILNNNSNISSCSEVLHINNNYKSQIEASGISLNEYEETNEKNEILLNQRYDNSSKDEPLFPFTLTNNFESKSSFGDKNKNKIFNIIYPEKYSSDFKNIKREIFIKKRRRDGKDNILRKIKCAFFNCYLFNRINNLLKKGKKHYKYFYKFSQEFIIDLVKNNNKKLFGMTLSEIIIENNSNKTNKTKKHNLDVLFSLRGEKNINLEKFLNSKCEDLFEEFINSNEYKNEIMRLKRKNMTSFYIKNYKYLSTNFIKFFDDNSDI